jgi:hypothetical protein
MPPSPQPPSLRFCYPEALHAKALHLLDALEQATTRPDIAARWAISWWN